MKHRWQLHIKNQGENEATILLYGVIGDEEVDDRFVARRLQEIDGPGKRINVRINSPGGFINAGYGIFNALLNAKADVHTYNDGEASSMASAIFMTGKTRNMAKTATLMIHPPSSMAGGRSEDFRREADLLDTLEGQLIDIYTERSGKNETEIRDLMNQEKHLTAEEAKDMGFVDEIFNKSVKKASDASRKELRSMVAMAMSQQTDSHSETQNKDDMIKHSVAALLNIDAEKADDAKVIAAIQELKNKLEKAEGEKKELEEQLGKEQETRVETMVEAAVSEGKITSKEKETYQNLAKKDFESTKKVLDALTPRTKIADKMKPSGNGGGAEGKKSRDEWGFDDWRKKDPKGLRKMKDEDGERFEELLENWKEENARA